MKDDRIDKARAHLSGMKIGAFIRCSSGKLTATNPHGFGMGIHADGTYGENFQTLLRRTIDSGRQSVILHGPLGKLAYEETEGLKPRKDNNTFLLDVRLRMTPSVRANVDKSLLAAWATLTSAQVPTICHLGTLSAYQTVDGMADWPWFADAVGPLLTRTTAGICVDNSAPFRSVGHNDVLSILRKVLTAQGREFFVEGSPIETNSLFCSPEPAPCIESNRSLRTTLDQATKHRGDVRCIRLGHAVITVNKQPIWAREPAELAWCALLAADRGWDMSYYGIDSNVGVSAADLRREAHDLIPQLVAGVPFWQL